MPKQLLHFYYKGNQANSSTKDDYTKYNEEELNQK
jgi:hypothetical protein